LARDTPLPALNRPLDSGLKKQTPVLDRLASPPLEPGGGTGQSMSGMEHLKFPCRPVVAPGSCLMRGPLRISILKPGILRLEHRPDGIFEDRPSQHFWNREHEQPAWSHREVDGHLEVETSKMALRIPLGTVPSAANVRIRLPGATDWKPLADADPANLGGCLRTLDTVRGRWDYKDNQEAKVSPGLFSRAGWTVIDDSGTPVFNERGFLEPRDGNGVDLVVLAHGKDYGGTLRDYYAVAGGVPLPPKWALGIWWSRWERYTQADLQGLVEDFASRGIPLSVCVVDMDWHLPGWTGYTWNPEFFPDPEGFFVFLRRHGVRACLNLHPAEGVGTHEAAHAAMAVHMGLDPATAGPIPFDIANPVFIEGYFRHLHHPLEKIGVDFWWMDWQQGTRTSMPGLDPLWYLNHLHSLDLARDGRKRPLAFSRWGGWGAHRYPVGFSGDSSRTWDTLAFEIELTAQSANTGFGWWSHDIGGFCDGFPDDELYARWVQFGLLSPILRFHNCGDPTLDYRPWSKGEATRNAAMEALRLRNALVPYLYTAAWKNHLGEPPPCRPLYFEWPDEESAMHCPGQYLFGPSLLAAPIDSPADPETRLARKVVWLPPGEWFDFFDGTAFEGGCWTALHGGLSEIPLFARAGSAIPLATGTGLEWVVFPGTGESELHDDDGHTMDHATGSRAHVRLLQAMPTDRQLRLVLEKSGNERFGRGPFAFRLRGFHGAPLESVRDASGLAVPFRQDGGDWLVGPFPEGLPESLHFDFANAVGRKPRWSAERFWKILHGFHINSHAVRQMKESGVDFVADPLRLAPYRMEFSRSQMWLIAEEALGCGFEWLRRERDRDVVVWWNHHRRADFSVRLSRCEWLRYFETVHQGESGGLLEEIPHGSAVRGWKAIVHLAGLVGMEVGNDKTGRPEAGRRLG
jgi:hypothetical protein